MAKATITFTDLPDGETNIKVDFGDAGAVPISSAHGLAYTAFKAALDASTSEEDTDEGEAA